MEPIKISYGVKSLTFDGKTVTLATLRDTTTIPVQRIASIDMPSYLNMKMVMKIVTVDGHVHEYPAAYKRGKLRAFREAVLAAQQGSVGAP